jgi:polysaccharide biosynthesis protein PslG
MPINAQHTALNGLLRPALLAGALALLACLPGSAAAAPALTTSLLRGANIEYANVAGVERELSAAKALHAGVVRVLVRWSQVEAAGPGQIAPGPSGALDKLVQSAAAAGIKVIMVVDGTPCWASSAPTAVERACAPGRESEANSWPPLEASQYGAFMAYLAQRYGGQLAALEVWNEPDQSNERYLAGPDKAPHYAALLKAAYRAIKAVNPQLPVLGGSLVGPNGAFLKALYENGIKGFYDGLAVHFYTLTIASLRAIHEVQLQNGDSTPLWLDEFGWSSCWPRMHVEQEQGCVTRKVQSANLVNLTRAIVKLPYVAAELFYKLRNTQGEQFGVITEGGERKPAFAGVARAFGSPFGKLPPVTLRLRRHRRLLIASGSAPVGDYLELEVLKSGEPRYRTIFGLDRFNRYSIKLPAAVGAHRLLVRVWQYGSGVASATQRRI